jgi:hypothetical protein
MIQPLELSHEHQQVREAHQLQDAQQDSHVRQLEHRQVEHVQQVQHQIHDKVSKTYHGTAIKY